MRVFGSTLFCFVAIVATFAPAMRVDAEAPTVRVATFQCDVTPPLGQPIYSGYRPLATIEHPLLAKGVLIDDGRVRYVLCSLDWCEVCNGTHTLFRTLLAEAVGTHPDRVVVHTVHQHTAPMADVDALRILQSLDDPPPHPEPGWIERLAREVAAAARESVERLQPVDRLGLGAAAVERVAATRRVKGNDGRIRVRWSGCTDPELCAAPEGNIDPRVRTLTLARGEEPIVRLHYYAVHPQSFYGDPRASYDFPGMAREALQQRDGAVQIYFTGCAGDVTAGKYNDRSPAARDGLAERLQAGMQASIDATRFEPIDTIRLSTTPITLPLRTDAGYTAEAARAKMLDPKLAPSQRIYDGAMRLATVARADRPYVLSALHINRAHIVHLPGECMIDFQHFAQQQRPDEFVAVAAYGDCAPGYICTAAAFDEGGYEPTASGVVPRSEQIVKDAIRELLERE